MVIAARVLPSALPTLSMKNPNAAPNHSPPEIVDTILSTLSFFMAKMYAMATRANTPDAAHSYGVSPIRGSEDDIPNGIAAAVLTTISPAINQYLAGRFISQMRRLEAHLKKEFIYPVYTQKYLDTN